VTYTPELQVTYTPELQVKLYAGVTGTPKTYTPELQVKLYAGVTGEISKLRCRNPFKIDPAKTIRRSYR
jgi:hypothetical protein